MKFNPRNEYEMTSLVFSFARFDAVLQVFRLACFLVEQEDLDEQAKPVVVEED